MGLRNNIVNILHIIDHYRIGGPGKTILNSAKYIDPQKFAIHVSTFVGPRHRNTELSAAIIESQIPHLLLLDKKGITLGHLANLRNYILREKIQILHTHGYKTSLLGFLIKPLLKNICLVTTQHGWITNSISQKIYMKADLFLNNFFDGIIVVSKDMMAMLPSTVRSRTNIAVINNALVIDDYRCKGIRPKIREEYSVLDHEILIGVIGRLSNEKGCKEMLEAFRRLQKQVSYVKLIFVGDGPLSEEMQTQIRSLGLRDKVVLAGHRNPVQPFYEAIDILVNPSYTEGLSNVLLEALAFRLPVVGTRVGGNAEIITHGYNGLLVDSNSSLELHTAILELIRSSRLRSFLGNNGYHTVKTMFSFEKRMERIQSFYLNLLSSKSQ